MIEAETVHSNLARFSEEFAELSYACDSVKYVERARGLIYPGNGQENAKAILRCTAERADLVAQSMLCLLAELENAAACEVPSADSWITKPDVEACTSCIGCDCDCMPEEATVTIEPAEARAKESGWRRFLRFWNYGLPN